MQLSLPRVPHEAWTHAPLSTLAQKYDSVERHGWYANLDPTVQELARFLRDDDVLVDYSGGTGILVDRLLAATPRARSRLVIVDASPKFLRLALDKLRAQPRVAFRLLHWRADEHRLDALDEAVPELVGRARAIASANAMHLYGDLDATFAGWRRTLGDRADARVFAQSGNVRHVGAAASDAWIIDDTVRAVADEAARIVTEDEGRFARYRSAAGDRAEHDAYRAMVFPAPRPLATYVDALERAGFRIVDERTRRVEARTSEWLEFLHVYHDAVLGWVGGTEKIDGAPPASEALRDRFDLMRLAMERVMRGRATFDATWTYLVAAPR